jgi:hypothetical protein
MNNPQQSIHESHDNPPPESAIQSLENLQDDTGLSYECNFDPGNLKPLQMFEDSLGQDNTPKFCDLSELSYSTRAPTRDENGINHGHCNNLASLFPYTHHQPLMSQSQSQPQPQRSFTSKANDESSFQHLSRPECGLLNIPIQEWEQPSATAWTKTDSKPRSSRKTVIVLEDSNPEMTAMLLDTIVRAEIKATITMT